MDNCYGVDGVGCGDTGSCCRTIQYTITISNSSDTIQLQPGVFTDPENINLNITINNLTIASANGPNSPLP